MMLAPLVFLLAAQPVPVEKTTRRPSAAPVATPILSDEQILKNVHVDASGPALIDFFRQRVTPSVAAEHLAELTKHLNDSTEAVYAKAAAELVGLGPLAAPALRRAINQAGNEQTLARARNCLQAIEGSGGSAVAQSAVRVLAARKPEGAAEALLNYLPFADDDTVMQEIETALLTVGLRGGRPESALTRALRDPVPVRRGIAARVLCQVGGTAGRNAVRPLLKDAKPSVRMQAALSLSDCHDPEALPVLIDLVADLPPDGRKRVETYLTELAGEWAVKTPQGDDATSNRLRRELWTAWWRTLDGQRLLEEFRSRISGKERYPLPEAAPRLLALRRPEGAVETLLAYVPFAESESVAAQLTDLLAAIGCTDGKADPVLVRALEDKIAVRRAAAAVALCRGKADDQLPAVRKLLRDADPTVRLRTALALAQRGDERAVPVLIALLADLPLEQVWEAEDVLTALAGDEGASIPPIVGGDKAGRAASVKAWKVWWSKEENKIDLAKLSDAERGSGLLLVVDMRGGRVLETSRNGRIRWQFSGPQWPWDAVVCRNGHVFVAQQNNNQVSLWSRQGKEIWQKPCNLPFACQQLRNGNLFVVCRQHFVEFDANGKELSSHNPSIGWIVGGCKFANGHVGLFTQQGQYVRLDAAGKQIKSYQVAALQGGVAQNVEVLPGDRVVASLNIGGVAEYDDKGKAVWQTNIINPAIPHRLPNGHTLVGQNGMNHLYEMDRKGKILSEKKDLEYRPWRIRRR